MVEVDWPTIIIAENFNKLFQLVVYLDECPSKVTLVVDTRKSKCLKKVSDSYSSTRQSTSERGDSRG